MSDDPTSDPAQHGFAEFARFAEDFKAESDRAAVILGAAKLDMMLFQILQARLVPCATGKDELLEGDNPLGIFSARINMAFRLGIITAEFARALHLIRRIRNSYAHEFSGVSLSSGAHRDRVRELVLPFVSHRGFLWILKRFFGNNRSPATEFRAAVAMLCLRLEGKLEATKPILPEDASTLLPPQWDDDKEQQAETAAPNQALQRTGSAVTAPAPQPPPSPSNRAGAAPAPPVAEL